MSQSSTFQKIMPNKIVENLSTMKETTIIYILTGITIFIILAAISYYCYYAGSLFNSSLPVRSCKTIDAVYGTINGNLKSITANDPQFEHNLNEYYIKSAYNCCSIGSYRNDYVDLCSLKDVLKQGVRGLDFEIYSINDQPVVATSTMESYYIKETYNYLPFSDVMNMIKNYAFSASNAPNFGDPILIHLRIKSTNQAMYQNFANLLQSYNSLLLDKTYSFENQGKNLGSVPILNLLGKIIIIVDRTNNSFLECKDFYEYVNMTSNSIFMRALPYYDVKYTPDINELIEFNKLGMTIGLPDKGTNPSNPSAVVLRETGSQMIAMRYELIDVNVEESDAFFNTNGYAFVLKPERLRYIPVTIEAPPPQDPSVSYGTRTVSSDFYNFNI